MTRAPCAWLCVIARFALYVGPPFEPPLWYEIVFRTPAAAAFAAPIAIPRQLIDV